MTGAIPHILEPFLPRWLIMRYPMVLLLSDKTPQETLDVVKNAGRWELVLFWVMWLILTGIVIVSFCHMDNDWLD